MIRSRASPQRNPALKATPSPLQLPTLTPLPTSAHAALWNTVVPHKQSFIWGQTEARGFLKLYYVSALARGGNDRLTSGRFSPRKLFLPRSPCTSQGHQDTSRSCQRYPAQRWAGTSLRHTAQPLSGFLICETGTVTTPATQHC